MHAPILLCAILVGAEPAASIVGWGSNSYRQLNIPPLNTDFVSVAAGGVHSLALKTNGSVVEWGYCASGECTSYYVPLPAPNSGFQAIAAGANHSLGLKSDGSIVAWGICDLGPSFPVCDVPFPNTDFVAAAGGGSHSLGLKSDGSIVAWGNNYYGQRDVPAPNTGFLAVAAGGYHSLGLRADGSIAAWGCGDSTNFGQCDVPAPNTNFLGIAAGAWHSVGVKADGSLVAWGQNDYGQCNLPVPNTDFAAVAAGFAYSLGLKQDDSVVVWGCAEPQNYGQCSDIPLPNAGVVAVAGGGSHILTLRVDGDLDTIPDVFDNCPDHANPNQVDCDTDGTGDVCAIVSGLSADCNGNGTPDECDIANCPPEDPSCQDCNGDGVLDACQLFGPATKLTASNATASSQFGHSACVSGDRVIVGARGADGAAFRSGAAYVFRKTSGDWQEETRLVGPEAEPSAQFGWSVATDGLLAVVSAPFDTRGSRLFVFKLEGDLWLAEQVIAIPGSGAGYSLAISRDRIIAGAPNNTPSFPAGSTYVFRRTGAVWALEAQLLPVDGLPDDSFGTSVSIDGSVAAVQAVRRRTSDPDTYESLVYVFRRVASAWEVEAVLVTPDVSGPFSNVVSVAVEDDLLVVGADQDQADVGLLPAGAAYVFERTGGVWSQSAKLVARDSSPGNQFGCSVAISGNVILVGSFHSDTNGGLNAGAAYVFRRFGASWVEFGKLTAPDGSAGDSAGFVVSISGIHAVTGAPYDSLGAGFDHGSAYVYAIGVVDCDGNGLDDQCDITTCAGNPRCADCNANGVPDGCDIADDTSTDCNANVVPDECECLTADAPQYDVPVMAKNRYVSVRPGATGCRTAIRVTLGGLPAPWNAWNGRELWLGPPTRYTELSGVVRAADAPPGYPAYWGAGLQCTPYYADWGSLGTVHVLDAGVVPAGSYSVQAVHEGCDVGSETSYSPALVIGNARWGDIAGPYNATNSTWRAPDGRVDVTVDVVADLEKFSNRPGAPTKARADVEPCKPDLLINITDVTRILDAFRGLPFPFAPGLGNPPCPSDPCG